MTPLGVCILAALVSSYSNVARIPEELVANARRDEVAPIVAALDRGLNLEATTSEGATLLHVAVAAKADKVTAMLIARGANVSARDKRKRTPLHWAAESSADACVVLLAAAGAEIDARDDDERTPLHDALASQVIVLELLGRGAKVDAMARYWGGTPLERAIDHRHIDVAHVLIRHGADVNRSKLAANAAALGELGLMRSLVDAGLDLERFGGEAMISAATEDATSVLSLLLERGVKADVPVGATLPLFAAASRGNLASVRLLLPLTKDIDASLAVATEHHYVEIVQLLLARGADPSAGRADGKSARQWATSERDRRLLQLFNAPRPAATPSSTLVESDAWAIVVGGGKREKDGELARKLFDEEQADYGGLFATAAGFPKVVHSDDVSGMKPGFYVAVLGYCSKEEQKPLMRLLKGISEHVYARKVSSAEPGSCPTLSVTTKGSVTVSGIGGERLHVVRVIYDGGNERDSQETFVTLRNKKGERLDFASFHSCRGGVTAEEGFAKVSWACKKPICYEPTEGDVLIQSLSGRIEITHEDGYPYDDSSECGC